MTDNLTNTLSQIVIEKLKHQYEYDYFGVKMLLLSNGTALVVVASALDKISNLICPQHWFLVKISLFIYFLGLALGAVIYLMHWNVIAGAPGYYYNQLVAVAEKKKKIEELQGWTMLPKYQKIAKNLMRVSLLSFAVATVILISLVEIKV